MVKSKSVVNLSAANRHYTEADLDKIANMVIAGVNKTRIATFVQRTEKSIICLISNSNLKKTNSGKRLRFLIDSKRHQADIANLKVSMGAKKQLMSVAPKQAVASGEKPTMHKKPWTAPDNTRLIALFAQGTAPDEIAKELSRTVYSVLGKLHENKVLTFDKTKGTYFMLPQAYYKVKEVGFVPTP